MRVRVSRCDGCCGWTGPLETVLEDRGKTGRERLTFTFPFVHHQSHDTLTARRFQSREKGNNKEKTDDWYGLKEGRIPRV